MDAMAVHEKDNDLENMDGLYLMLTLEALGRLLMLIPALVLRDTAAIFDITLVGRRANSLSLSRRGSGLVVSLGSRTARSEWRIVFAAVAKLPLCFSNELFHLAN